jgi:hypothetical protein
LNREAVNDAAPNCLTSQRTKSSFGLSVSLTTKRSTVRIGLMIAKADKCLRLKVFEN